MPSRASVLVVDDHVEMARLLRDQLTDLGYQVTVAAGGSEAVEAIGQRTPDVVLTDLRMADVDGFDVLEAARAADPDLPVIIMTAFGAVETAVEAIKRGAYHYLTKPLRLDEVTVFVDRALRERRLRADHRALERLAGERTELGAMIGRSRKMQALFDLVERVALSPAPVLIRGESGTGKELVARAIHQHGPRRAGPFVPVNCTALPGNLLESELFGHVRGAFTGATTARRGLFAEADGGTLFLDEIGDMELGLQGKVLRVVQDSEVRAVGADTGRTVDVRLIAATNRNLEQDVRDGRFREDLFYRLNVVPIAVPPLRDRPDDIPPLIEAFLARARARNSYSPVRQLAPALVSALARLPWPGNVRELENLVERLVVIGARDTLEPSDVEEAAPGLLQAATPLSAARERMVSLKELEREYIDWVIEQCGGNKSRAAEILGVDVSTIHRRKRGGQ